MFVTLEEAFARVSIADVWDMAPNPNGSVCPRGDGVVKSPFRVDNKGASFSVTKGGMAFKDHAEPDCKGAAWQFIKLCNPEWTKREIARAMIERAGGDPDQKDPNGERPKKQTKTEWKAAKEQAKELAVARWEREQCKLMVIDDKLLMPAPQPVARRYEKGLERAAAGDFIEGLAAERVWPVDWAACLVEMGRLAAAPRGGAMFAVEAYCHKKQDWQIVGIHERWIAEDGGKMWSYRPNAKWDKRETCALPFVLGNPVSSVWIVAEGQWDAATIYGMLGGFDEFPAIEAFVVGIRGASGVNVFLSHYAKLLRSVRPAVVLFPDADGAAKGWTEDARKHAGALPSWSFARKLREIFNLDVAWLKCPAHKDINDWWRYGSLTAEQLVSAIMGVLKI